MDCFSYSASMHDEISNAHHALSTLLHAMRISTGADSSTVQCITVQYRQKTHLFGIAKGGVEEATNSRVGVQRQLASHKLQPVHERDEPQEREHKHRDSWPPQAVGNKRQHRKGGHGPEPRPEQKLPQTPKRRPPAPPRSPWYAEWCPQCVVRHWRTVSDPIRVGPTSEGTVLCGLQRLLASLIPPHCIQLPCAGHAATCFKQVASVPGQCPPVLGSLYCLRKLQDDALCECEGALGPSLKGGAAKCGLPFACSLFFSCTCSLFVGSAELRKRLPNPPPSHPRAFWCCGQVPPAVYPLASASGSDPWARDSGTAGCYGAHRCSTHDPLFTSTRLCPSQRVHVIFLCWAYCRKWDGRGGGYEAGSATQEGAQAVLSHGCSGMDPHHKRARDPAPPLRKNCGEVQEQILTMLRSEPLIGTCTAKVGISASP